MMQAHAHTKTNTHTHTHHLPEDPFLGRDSPLTQKPCHRLYWGSPWGPWQVQQEPVSNRGAFEQGSDFPFSSWDDHISHLTFSWRVGHLRIIP